MMVVRYSTEAGVMDVEVGAEYAVLIYNQAKAIYNQADLLFIEDGVEYCLL